MSCVHVTCGIQTPSFQLFLFYSEGVCLVTPFTGDNPPTMALLTLGRCGIT